MSMWRGGIRKQERGVHKNVMRRAMRDTTQARKQEAGSVPAWDTLTAVWRMVAEGLRCLHTCSHILHLHHASSVSYTHLTLPTKRIV